MASCLQVSALLARTSRARVFSSSVRLRDMADSTASLSSALVTPSPGSLRPSTAGRGRRNWVGSYIREISSPVSALDRSGTLSGCTYGKVYRAALLYALPRLLFQVALL